MTEQFKRDMGRYTVIKNSDTLLALDEYDSKDLNRVMRKIARYRENRGAIPLECVVVESDWPEYERVWAMIEARVTGKSEQMALGETAHQYAAQLLKALREIPKLRDSNTDGTYDDDRAFANLLDALHQWEDENENLLELSQEDQTALNECIGQTLDHFSLDTGKVEQVTVHGAGIIDRYPGREDSVVRSAPFTPGEKVEWCESGRWYPGTVKAVSGNMVLITDQHGNDGEYRFGTTPIVADGARKPFTRPSGHGPVAWFLAAVDDAREQGHENMILPRGLGNMIAEHISRLESQLAKFQQMATIYQVESTVEKDSEGNVTKLEWVDVSKEDADKAWNEFGLLVRTVRLEVKK